MSEVTAEMIERGRGADPRTSVERRRVALKVREAREKLTSGSGHRAFDLELLKLYAERRKAASLWLAMLAFAFGAITYPWTSPPLLVTWLCLDGASVLFAYGLAESFLRTSAPEINPNVDLRRWGRLFVVAEIAQGCAWAMVVALAMRADDPHAITCMLIALLLVAAMTATVTASLPLAVYGALAPMTAAIVVILRPTHLLASDALIAMLALTTLVVFVMLARKLYASALQALVFQAEKDDLIAELEQAKTNSDLARRRAEESNLAKSRFLATMSHELRTPLNAILGFSEVMKTELFGTHAIAAYKDYSSDIHSSGEHLLMLINEILDLSRVEAGRYELREEPVDLVAIIEECRHLMALRAKKKDIALLQDATEPLPRLWADQRAVRQVALNLLSNAVKFTPQGGQVRIAIGWTEDGGQFFSIADTGTGIPENEIPVVMASFGRGTLAQKTAEEGSGLGLPIVKGLVEIHGGTFELKSKIREGTDVTVRFPPERVMSVLPRLEVETDLPAWPRPTLVEPERSAA